jgi:hypothetical protein
MRSSKVRRKRRSGEIKLAHRVSIYRGRGDSFEKISRDDRCAFPGGRVHSDIPRVTFLPNC